jgi:N utilization substance protein A
VPTAELLAVEGFDEDIVEELRARARDALLTEALAVEEGGDDAQAMEGLEGMDARLRAQLAERGINSVEELADLAVIDLMDIDGMDEALAGALIMAARAPMIEKLEQGG